MVAHFSYWTIVFSLFIMEEVHIVETSELLTKIPEWLRSIFTTASEFLAKLLPFEADKIYILLILIIALFAASKLLNIIPRLRDSWVAWFGLAAVIYYFVQYL